MTEYTLHIKNMVCPRCIKVVREELERLGLKVADVTLGEAIVQSTTAPDLSQIREALEANGFALLEDKKKQLVEQIKAALIELIHRGDLESLNVNFSDYLSEKLDREYASLSQAFSALENLTIERFIILQKIEKVKELLVYDELSLSEISYRMGYSSPAHLSRQFHQLTGFTPSAFKKLKSHPRRPLDQVS